MSPTAGVSGSRDDEEGHTGSTRLWGSPMGSRGAPYDDVDSTMSDEVADDEYDEDHHHLSRSPPYATTSELLRRSDERLRL